MRRDILRELSGFVLLAPVLLAQPHWTRMASPNFEMYTTSGERDARDTLRYFEQVRGFFGEGLEHSTEKRPVRVVAFSSMKEFEPYRPNEFAMAYYQSGQTHDYIVMSHTGAETAPIAIHEYVHLVARLSKLNLPPWLNEGVAELYSTLEPRGDKILVGSLIEGRHQALLRDKWVPLEIITSAGQDSPYYNEKNKAGSLYNEGWALTHMLALKSEYRPKFPEFMQSMAAGGPCESILELVYGKTMNQIEKELIQYVNGTRFQGVLVPAKLGKLDGDLKAEPASDFDVKLVLAEVGDLKGKEEATRKALEGLIAADPKRMEPYEDLARLDLRQQRINDAREHLARAFDLGSRNPETLWNFGLMVQGSAPEKSAQAFTELLKQQPGRVDTRLALATLQLRKNLAKEALETLAPVKKVTPQDAPQLLTLLARANFENGDRVAAHAAAAQLKSLAKTPEQNDRADQLLRYVDGARAPSSATQAAGPRKKGDVPVLTRRDAPVSTVTEVHAAARPSFSGKFIELQCGPQVRIVLDTAEGKKRLLIDDPNKLMINGDGGEKMELTCGAQKPKQVRIEYDEAGASHPGVDGLARGIQFNP